MGGFLSALKDVAAAVDAAAAAASAVTESDLEQARATRQQAFELHDQANDYSRQSQEAYRAGDGGEAKRLSQMKNEAHAQADALHAQAERAVFAFYNDQSRLSSNNPIKPGEKWVDFHELLQKEVIERLNAMKGAIADEKTWIVIHGRGNHSKTHPGQSTLQGTVERWCQENGMAYAEDRPTVGCITVTVTAGKEQPGLPCCPVV